MNVLLSCLLLLAPAAVDLDSAIEEARVRIEELQESSGVPGVQVAVAVSDSLVWQEGFGWRDVEAQLPVTAKTRFGIGSITKTLTMVVWARLADRGRVDWDAPLETYLEGFPRPGSGITARRIGAHLSGMGEGKADPTSVAGGGERPPVTWREVVAAPPVHVPGEAHLYATAPFMVVAAAIESVEGASFFEVVSRELTEPLGLVDTVPYDPRHPMSDLTTFYERSDGELKVAVTGEEVPLGGSGYLSTARDLVLLGHAVIRTDFVSPENHAELLRDHRTNDGRPTFFGLGWRLGRSHEWGFFYGSSGGGPGVAAVLLLVPEFDLSVASLTNLTSAPSWEMARSTAEIFVNTLSEPRPPDGTDSRR